MAKKDNISLSLPNTCVASCLGFSILKDGPCTNLRKLGIWDSFKNTVNKAADSVKNAVNNAVSKTKDFIDDVKDKAKEIKDKVVDTFKKVVEYLRYRIRRIGEALQNCTCHVVEKIEKAVSDKFEQWAEEGKQELEKLKNKTKIWWDQTLDGFISVERKVAGWIKHKVATAAGLTVLVWVKTRDAIKRGIDWWRKLINCSKCSNDYVPVCIQADNGEKATMLNQCYAECGGLKVLSVGRCEDATDDDEGLVLDHVEL